MVSDKIKFEVVDAPATPTAFKALEKLGRLAIKVQENDAKIQRMVQHMMLPDTSMQVDAEAIHRAIAGYTPEPIIPKGYFEKTQEYQKKSLEVLQSINENTANLYTMVELINQNNEKQDELIVLMTEILSLAKAKSKGEADALFKKILAKINNTTDNVDSMIKIVGWATTVYNMVLPLLQA